MSWMHRVAAVILVACVCLAMTGCTSAGSRFDFGTDPMAAVLMPDGENTYVSIVDLTDFKVVERRKLRSLSLSIDGDRDSRVVMTAQCGLAGPDADDVIGYFTPGKGRGIDYFKLLTPNPGEVSVTGGMGYVLHGFLDDGGMIFSQVTVGKNRAVTESRVPSGSEGVVRVGRRIMVGGARVRQRGPDEYSRLGRVTEVSPSSVTTLAFDLPLWHATVVPSDDASDVIVTGRLRDMTGKETETWAVARLDGSSGRVLQLVEQPWAKIGLFASARTPEGIVVADSGGNSGIVPGGSVWLLDRDTLKPVLERKISGIPAAVGESEGKTLVLDLQNGELLEFGHGQLRPSRRVKIAKDPNVVADFVVFPRRPADSR